MSLEKVRSIIARHPVGFLASCQEGRPRVRPMSFVWVEPGLLWSSTYRQSGKVAELEHNQQVEICFLDDDLVQVRISGRASLGGGEREKTRLLELNPKVGRHFLDARDPKFVHVEIRPMSIRHKPTGFCEYTEVELPGA